MPQMVRAARHNRGRCSTTPTVLLILIILFAAVPPLSNAAPQNPLRVADDAPVIEAPAGSVYTNSREKDEIRRIIEGSDTALKPHYAQVVGKIKKAEGVVIFGNDYKIPKIYKENGEAKGILVEIARLVDDLMAGYALDIRLFPWARSYQHALHGRGGIIGLSKTSEREAIFDYSDVIYYDKVVIVTLREKPFNYREIADLRGKTIGIGRGGSFGDEYERARAAGVFKVEEDSGPVIRLKKLLRGRLDCALISPGRFALNQTIRQDPLLSLNRDRFVILPQPFKQDPNYLGFVKTMKMGGFLDAFNDALREAKASGAVTEIIDRYEGGGGGGPPPDDIGRGPPG